jgi:hypothetical protein
MILLIVWETMQSSLCMGVDIFLMILLNVWETMQSSLCMGVDIFIKCKAYSCLLDNGFNGFNL